MSQFRQQDNLLGQSDSFLAVLDQVSQLASLDKPVLIIGERGTGKELIAARLHFLSKRWEQNYIKLNCAALNENLLESELFGHESGAFTGASKRHEGRFERANSGTLFLDELANTSAMVQEKLLRVIEYGEFERVGGKQTVKVDTRLVCATNEDLPYLAEQGEFRSDLLDRLAFDVITLPPLRERQDDIMLLAEQFAINMARDLEWELFSGFTRSAVEILQTYDWPGNIRELKNVVERSLYRHGNEHIPVHQIILDPFESKFRPKQRIKAPLKSEQTEIVAPSTVEVAPVNKPAQHTFPCSLKDLSNEFEIDLIKKALEFSQFNQKKTAEVLGLTYHQLRGYLKKYNLLDQQQ
ncbi:MULTISPECIES: phage shock protein operon transcriptional activator [unclassified Pseudoalteromonas]|uniref:phage shock protein operon transcriptional activator n=1 Tax=unclassified Pseudoalteromonas TaxID=194690 RepID=UPI000B3C7B4E|nr:MULTISPECIES: phage shock protein operon transcriptional activator [unclassified Pseudoalteromonas]MDN3378084.1 phage shock protein operon transcriptional activator [Pseudoalteromonas sp. APC 3893]MDN3386849.1 phage shock protein operon transcriptional activator [Pseudoalteromonas sp. APC 4017]OUS74556.1 phage shock protein operon transcriptional activator [Pseudoalteromonas sp. A601]